MSANDAATVAWNDVAGETGYWVEKSPDGMNGWRAVHAAALPANTTHFTNPALEAGDDWYHVRAVDNTSSASSGG